MYQLFRAYLYPMNPEFKDQKRNMFSLRIAFGQSQQF